ALLSSCAEKIRGSEASSLSLSSRSMRGISTVSMPHRVALPARASAASTMPLPGADDQRRIGTGESAADDERDIAPGHLCFARDAKAGTLRIEPIERGHTRHDAFAQRFERDDGLGDPRGGDEMPDGPFERRDRRGGGARAEYLADG